VIQAAKHRSWEHALRPYRLRVERYRTCSADGSPGSQTARESACSQRHLLGAADRRPWRDLPERYGPYTSAYNRFNRWRKAGIWDRSIVKAYDGKVQMIDSPIVRVHQHAWSAKKRLEIVAWAEAEVASPRKSTRRSMRKAAR
jgi:transposase